LIFSYILKILNNIITKYHTSYRASPLAKVFKKEKLTIIVFKMRFDTIFTLIAIGGLITTSMAELEDSSPPVSTIITTQTRTMRTTQTLTVTKSRSHGFRHKQGGDRLKEDPTPSDPMESTPTEVWSSQDRDLGDDDDDDDARASRRSLIAPSSADIRIAQREIAIDSGKRGIAYSLAKYTGQFSQPHMASKVSWGYNWYAFHLQTRFFLIVC
jgi:hypothetical protein